MSTGKLFLLLCVIVIGLSGCAASQHHHDAYGARGPLTAAASSAGEGLQQVGRDEALLFIYAAVAVAIVFVVIVDLVLLPVGCRNRAYYFPCCRALISCCH